MMGGWEKGCRCVRVVVGFLDLPIVDYARQGFTSWFVKKAKFKLKKVEEV